MTPAADPDADLLQSEGLFESIIENMGESVLVVDRNGKQIYGNKMLARFQGAVDPGESLDAWRSPVVMKIADANGRELPFEQWPVARALRGDDQDNFEIRVHGMAHAEGETCLLTSTRCLRNAAGEIVGAFVVTRDITSIKQTEEILRQSQKLETIGQLTGGIAHDFNNMLAAILGAAEVLKRAVSSDPRLDLAATTIEKAALRGAELTRHLLAFARKQTLSPVQVDLNALVREDLLLLRPALGATIDVEIESQPDVFALADPAQLTSALLNLCINARDAMGEQGGRITISVERLPVQARTGLDAGEYVRLAVTDTGHGMSPDTIRRAAEPFFTTKEVGKGSGLGLSMVYGFARQSGGDLQIESEVGKGSTIAMLLPNATAPSATIAPQRLVKPVGPLRILIVDDDPQVRDALSLQLSDAGFEGITAEDGHEALALIEEGETFDLLLTDMVMPKGLSGVDLAQAVRERIPDIRIVISTGYVDRELPPAPDGQAWRLLRKPYSSAELFASLRDAMLGR